MNLKTTTKNIIKNKVRKVIFHAIKPYLPLLILILIIILLLCTILDTTFVQGIQLDSSLMSEDELKLKNKCIELATVINTCNNFADGLSTNHLLDVNNLEENKQIEWSHLYILMVIQSLNNNYRLLDFDLLEQMANYFISTFTYTTNNIVTETKTINDDNEEIWTITSEETEYILIESDTIYGHYNYNYELKTTISDDGNTRTTKKVYVSETLIGEQYAKLKDYLIRFANIRSTDLDTTVDLVINSASGYYDNTLTNNGNAYLGKGMFTWPIPGYTTITSNFGMRVNPTDGVYKLHGGTDVSAPIGANFVAMADGIVIRANYSSSYGNVVMIEHRKWYCYFICTRF